MPEQYLTTALLVVAASAIWYVARQLKTTIITSIPGPPSSSFPLGNFKEYYQDEVGEHEFAWQERFGGVYRIKGLLGQDRLMISDPKALQYIYQNVDKNWLKPIARRELGRMFLGRGIAWSEAEDHKRHRKIMTPAFGNIESRGMMPVMRSVAQRMCQYWKNITSNSASEVSCEIEVSEWLSRATLDTIGEAAFNYQFGSMENSNNRLAQSYNNMLVDAFNLPSPTRIFAQLSLAYLPMWVFRMIERLPSKSIQRLRMVADEGNRVAKQLVELATSSANNQDRTGKDFMDILVRANISEDPRNRLSEEELLAEMRTVIAAGHLTTGNSLCFILYELARHPDVQERVHAEVSSMLSAVSARGDAEYTMADLDGMHYILAVLKEALRLHPVVFGPSLYSTIDDVLPLSKPIRTTDGKLLSELPISAGQNVHISISGYNRLKDIWGPDAHEFRPTRFLDGSVAVKNNFGVFAGLGNFASGGVSCLGWRFAVIEMQTFLVEIMRQFELSLPPGGRKVFRAASGVMSPLLADQPEKGMQLPLMVATLP